MKIIFCGSREWGDRDKILQRMKQLDRTTLIIEGDARGADRIAGEIADELGMPHIKVAANWDYYQKAAGPIRNRWMLDLEPDLIIAFHSNIAESKGTKDCLTEATRRKILVEVIT